MVNYLGQEAAARCLTLFVKPPIISLFNFQQPTSGLLGSGSVANPATSVQSAKQAAGAVGTGNQIQQQTGQGNLQQLISQPSSQFHCFLISQ